MGDDRHAWWYVPGRTRTVSAPVAAVLGAMGAADLVRAGPTFWLGWLLLVLGAGVGTCVVASQRRDDLAGGGRSRRAPLLGLGLVLVALAAVAANVALAAYLGA